MQLSAITTALADAHVVDHPSWFRIYVTHKGMASRLRTGTYQLRDDMTPKEVLAALVKGVEEQDLTVTIPEGKSYKEAFEILASLGIPAADFDKVGRDPQWLKNEGIDGDTPEGYLFPDTYRFKKTASAKDILEAMVKRHRVVYEELRKRHGQKLADLQAGLKLGDREIVIMASLVEKETSDAKERPRIAGVFYNRLRSSKFPSRRLETDPTIRYGCEVLGANTQPCKDWDPKGRLHKPQLTDADNPYNTYTHAGLPPGPICNPGKAALDAAMGPEKTDYLFFVAKDEKSHDFSKTFEEHDAKVKKYQRP
jgi:UPF0755 protein